jgi:hypothetical protein
MSNPMDLRIYIKQHSLKWKNCEYESRLADIFPFPFEIKPREFIAYANNDLELESKQGLIGALKNAKSAIDCQVDAILKVLGLKKGRNFPQKAEQINQLGLLAPRVLKRIVKLRNRLEHDFSIPEKHQVEDAVDIASLFIETTDRIFRYFDIEFIVGELEYNQILDLEKGEYLHFTFNPNSFFYTVSVKKDGNFLFKETIKNNSNLYIPILRMSILCDLNYWSEHYKKSIDDFFNIVKETT